MDKHAPSRASACGDRSNSDLVLALCEKLVRREQCSEHDADIGCKVCERRVARRRQAKDLASRKA